MIGLSIQGPRNNAILENIVRIYERYRMYTRVAHYAPALIFFSYITPTWDTDVYSGVLARIYHSCSTKLKKVIVQIKPATLFKFNLYFVGYALIGVRRMIARVSDRGYCREMGSIQERRKEISRLERFSLTVKLIYNRRRLLLRQNFFATHNTSFSSGLRNAWTDATTLRAHVHGVLKPAQVTKRQRCAIYRSD